MQNKGSVPELNRVMQGNKKWSLETLGNVEAKPSSKFSFW